MTTKYFIKLLLLFVLLIPFQTQGCSTMDKNISPAMLLNKRINKFYQLKQNGLWIKCYHFYDEGNFKSEDEFRKIAKQNRIKLKSFEIEKIEINNNSAKVFMILTLITESGIEHKDERLWDMWILKRGTWFLKEVGRGMPDDKRTVKPFDFNKYFPPEK